VRRVDRYADSPEEASPGDRASIMQMPPRGGARPREVAPHLAGVNLRTLHLPRGNRQKLRQIRKDLPSSTPGRRGEESQLVPSRGGFRENSAAKRTATAGDISSTTAVLNVVTLMRQASGPSTIPPDRPACRSTALTLNDGLPVVQRFVPK